MVLLARALFAFTRSYRDTPSAAHWLAARIAATTVYNGVQATPCPTCWDPSTQQQFSANDARCFGSGWIVPASGAQPEIGGYLPPVPFDCLVLPGSLRSEMTPDGYQPYSTDTTAEWVRQNITAPKKTDVVIAVVAGQARTERFVVGDVVSVSDLGSVTIVYRAQLEPRDPRDQIYRIALPDTSGPEQGSWE